MKPFSFVLIVFLMVCSAGQAGDREGNGDFTVYNGTDLADFHIRRIDESRFEFSPELERALRASKDLLENVGVNSRQLWDFFEGHVFAKKVRYLPVQELPVFCKDTDTTGIQAQDPKQFACTRGNTTFLVIGKMKELAQKEVELVAAVIVHERLRSWNPHEVFDVYARFTHLTYALLKARTLPTYTTRDKLEEIRRNGLEAAEQLNFEVNRPEIWPNGGGAYIKGRAVIARSAYIGFGAYVGYGSIIGDDSRVIGSRVTQSELKPKTELISSVVNRLVIPQSARIQDSVVEFGDSAYAIRVVLGENVEILRSKITTAADESEEVKGFVAENVKIVDSSLSVDFAYGGNVIAIGRSAQIERCTLRTQSSIVVGAGISLRDLTRLDAGKIVF